MKIRSGQQRPPLDPPFDFSTMTNKKKSALTKVYGQYIPTSRLVSGAYAEKYSKQDEFQDVIDRVKRFTVKAGRNPRILIAKVGQDGHDRGQKVVATGFADLGFGKSPSLGEGCESNLA